MKYSKDDCSIQYKRKPDIETIRVIPQFTMVKNLISLMAEETHDPYKKGDLVTQVNRKVIDEMERPFQCKLNRTKVKGKEKVTARVIRRKDNV